MDSTWNELIQYVWGTVIVGILGFAGFVLRKVILWAGGKIDYFFGELFGRPAEGGREAQPGIIHRHLHQIETIGNSTLKGTQILEKIMIAQEQHGEKLDKIEETFKDPQTVSTYGSAKTNEALRAMFHLQEKIARKLEIDYADEERDFNAALGKA